LTERYATREEVEGLREELEPHLKISIVAVLSTLSDYATTKIALRYPELYEWNPNVNFEMEFLFAEAGGIGLYTLAKFFKQPTDIALVLGLVPAATPFLPALNNLVATARVHSFYINWDEISLLYREGK